MFSNRSNLIIVNNESNEYMKTNKSHLPLKLLPLELFRAKGLKRPKCLSEAGLTNSALFLKSAVSSTLPSATTKEIPYEHAYWRWISPTPNSLKSMVAIFMLMHVYYIACWQNTFPLSNLKLIGWRINPHSLAPIRTNYITKLL